MAIELVNHPSGLTPNQQELAKGLMKINAIRFGEFKFAHHKQDPDAKLSPSYINLRMLQSDPDVKDLAVDEYIKILKPLNYDLIAGIPMAITPVASSIQDRLRVGMRTPRLEDKGYGSGDEVDGWTPGDEGKIIAVLDDLVSEGLSKLKAVSVLERMQYRVNDLIVLIDRQRGGLKKMQDLGYNVHYAFTVTQLMDFYLSEGLVTPQQHEADMEFINSKKSN